MGRTSAELADGDDPPVAQCDRVRGLRVIRHRLDGRAKEDQVGTVARAHAGPILERRERCVRIIGKPSFGQMDWTTLVPAIIGAFVGVMGWLIVGLYIQRRQFHRQARNAAKAVYFELDVNLATISVARDHGLFSDLDRSSFERLLPELATLLAASDLRVVVDAYMVHAGYKQLASRDDLPGDVRRGALTAMSHAHEQALATLRGRVFTTAEARAIGSSAPVDGPARQAAPVARTKP